MARRARKRVTEGCEGDLQHDALESTELSDAAPVGRPRTEERGVEPGPNASRLCACGCPTAGALFISSSPPLLLRQPQAAVRCAVYKALVQKVLVQKLKVNLFL